MHLLGLDFEPRIPRLSDRRLYAFEPARHYGRLAPLFGQRLDRNLIAAHWGEIGRVVEALRNRTVVPPPPHPEEAVGLPPAELARRGPARGRARRAHAVHPTLVQGPRAPPVRHRRAQQGRGPQQSRARRGPASARPRQATAASRTSRSAPPPSTSSPRPSSCSTAATSAAPWSSCGAAAAGSATPSSRNSHRSGGTTSTSPATPSGPKRSRWTKRASCRSRSVAEAEPLRPYLESKSESCTGASSALGD